jgi:hypothetical protein
VPARRGGQAMATAHHRSAQMLGSCAMDSRGAPSQEVPATRSTTMSRMSHLSCHPTSVVTTSSITRQTTSLARQDGPWNSHEAARGVSSTVPVECVSNIAIPKLHLIRARFATNLSPNPSSPFPVSFSLPTWIEKVQQFLGSNAAL